MASPLRRSITAAMALFLLAGNAARCAAAASASPLFRPTAFATSRRAAAARSSSAFGTRSFLPPSSSVLFAATADAETKGPVPVTLLAGFLGSGKTTALKNLLENRDGVKVGVVVNDVAAVNIDAKLIANPGNEDGAAAAGAAGEGEAIETEYGGTVELQNGCACCSLADELLTSVETLMTGRDFDAVVVELSGVADPVAVKQNWEQAKAMDHPATRLADVNRVVTVVDGSTFGTDWMTWDSAGDRDNWTEEGDDCAGQRKVPELLAEQVEAADLLLVNKIDLAGPAQVEIASAVARGINDRAAVFEVEFGKVSPKEILGPALGAAAGAAVVEKEEKKEEEGHDHAHSHDHADDAACADPDCTDTSHSHSHDHAAEASCDDPDCTDTSHSHSHDHAAEASCDDPDCTDTSHSHSHDHAEGSCSDPDCTDTSHSHSHDHGTSTDKLGISNFVYKSDRPFNSNRLLLLLNRWPVPIKDELDILQMQRAGDDGAKMDDGVVEDSPFVGVLRSKGFCWMSPVDWTDYGDAWRHDTAMYWSHAGKHFGITTAGKWWGSIGKDKIKDYFTNNMREYERIMNEDWVSDEWGDRRQELVFIGTGIDEGEITKALDDCLCTDEELDKYRADVQNFMARTFSVQASGGPSLFDTETTEHMDVDK